MALSLTDKAFNASKETAKEPQLILKIDGFSEIFGARPIEEAVRVGMPDLEIGGFNIGGTFITEDSRPWINLKTTTKEITQQIETDRKGSSGINSFRIGLIDKDAELTRIFNNGNTVNDILGQKCEVFIGFVGTAFPTDTPRIYSGICSGITFPAGQCILEIQHPDGLKRQDIFIKYDDELNGSLTDIETTIPVNNTSDLILGSDILKTYVRIDNELMLVNSKTNTTINVTRGQLNTANVAHNGGSVESFYRLEGNPIEASLKLMLSNGGGAFEENLSVSKFNQMSSTEFIQNAIYFENENIAEDLGIVTGDFVTITGAVNPQNNATDKTIIGFDTLLNGSYLVIDDVDFVTETGASAVVSITSKYNTLPSDASLSMTPDQVDVAQFERIRNLTGSTPDIDLYIKDTTKGTELIDEKILWASGYFSIPRKGKSSVNATLPPLATGGNLSITSENINNPFETIKITRSINKNFYNRVIYKYNQSALEDKFLSKEIIISTESENNIGVGVRALTIEAPSYRPSTGATAFFNNNGLKQLNRYKFGAETLEIKPNFGDAFNIDVGDTCTLNLSDIPLTDTKKGARGLEPRIYEITNKSLSIDGDVRLQLTDTLFSTDFRFSVVGPSSFIDTGSTTTKIILKRSFVADENAGTERLKYEKYIGEKIRIHNEDFTFDETVTLLSFDAQNEKAIIVNPALSIAPLENYILDMPSYSSGTNSNYKIAHAFLTPQVEVTSGTSNTVFDVADVSKFFLNTRIRVHNEDFTNDSGNVKIIDITGSTITVDTDMGFTPSTGDLIDLIGFASDSGKPYVLF